MKKLILFDLGGTITCYTENRVTEFYSEKGTPISALIDKNFFSEELELCYEHVFNKISHEITLDDLITLGNKIQDAVDDPNIFGVVVSVGTNVLEDIAYFIGIVVKTNKNIVFTGAFNPQNSLGFDGEKNLYNAIVINSTFQKASLGVLVTFNDTVITARSAIKISPGISNNYASHGQGIVGHVVGGVFYNTMIPLYKHTYDSEFSIRNIYNLPKILLVYAHLGMDKSYIEFAIQSGKIKGIVSAGFGKGYQNKEISILLSQAASNNIPVVRCSRSGHGYSSTDKQYDNIYGFNVVSNLSPHKSSILLSVCLTQSSESHFIKKIFQEY